MNWFICRLHSGKRLLLCAALLGFMHSASALNLLEAYEFALVRDPSFQSATREYEAGMQNALIGRSALLPKLFANYSKAANSSSITGQQQINGVPVGPYQYNANYPSDSAAIQVTQPIFSLDALARARQGKAQTSFSQSKFLYLTLEVANRVLQAYTDLLFAMDRARYQLAEFEAFSEQAKVSKRLFEKGEAAQTDYLQSESSAQIAKAKVTESNDEIENARIKLEGIIGQPVDLKKIAKLGNTFAYIKNDNVGFNVFQEKALANNAELLAMKDQIEIANQEYKKNIASHFPVVNLVAAASSATSTTTVTINQRANTTYAGVQVSLPIYGGGEIHARSTQAYANYQKALADYDVARVRVLAELRKQFNLYQSSKAKIQALMAAQSASTKLVDSMRRGVKAGERTNLDILTADKTLFNANQDLAQAKYQYLTSFLRLNQTSGTFEFDDLQTIANYFK